jgi:signal transduction histidine kinase
MGAVTDVTARKEAEQALDATEERLRQSQKMEAVGQLTGGIAHDFNNLLTTIMGSLELLQQRTSLDERSLRLTANALEGSRRAARLTSQLLSFSRRQRLAPEPLRPRDVIDGIHDLLARTAGDGTALDIVFPAEEWLLMADRNQLEAALLTW